MKLRVIGCSGWFAYSFLVLTCQGATIVDQHVCITRWGSYEDENDTWYSPLNHEVHTGSTVCIKLDAFCIQPWLQILIIHEDSITLLIIVQDTDATATIFIISCITNVNVPYSFDTSRFIIQVSLLHPLVKQLPWLKKLSKLCWPRVMC